MPLFSRSFFRLALFVAAGVACNTGTPLANPSAPIVIAVGGKTGLEYWPLMAKGSNTPTPISGITGLLPTGNLAVRGSQVIIPNGSTVIVYDLNTKRQTVLPDPSGSGLDAAVGRDGTIYVANEIRGGSNVAMYPPAGPSRILSCPLVSYALFIAVDNEGDIFLDDITSDEIAEIPNGPSGPDPNRCTTLDLKPAQTGYAAGITIDPNTDDLLVLDDPDLCAGGIEGRLVIHKKPYTQGVGRSLVVGRNCSEGVRLNAASNVVIVGDRDVSQLWPFLLERTYPQGIPFGAYTGGNPFEFAIMP